MKGTQKLFLRIASIALLCFILTSSLVFPAFANAEANGDENDAENSDIMIGIDVSSHNGTIDWAKVKAAGVDFAMIRICSRAGNTSDYVLDSKFSDNVKGATEQGIHVGAYFFSYAESVEAVAEEANMIVEILDQYPATFSFPIAFDAEEGDPDDGFDITAFAADACQTFCDILIENGYYSMVYANSNWLNNVILPSSKISGYDIWQAHFKTAYAGYTPEQCADIASARPTINSNNENVKIWQLTDSGKVDGISENTDLNISYCDFPKIIIEGNFNGYHTHEYKLVYNETEHYKECECGEIEPLTNEPHILSESISEAGHFERCDCGFEELVSEHVFDIKKYDEDSHWSECECGEIDLLTKAAHTLTQFNDETGHREKCDCGFEMLVSEHVFDIEKYDADAHWLECECGEIEPLSKKDHALTDGVGEAGHYERCACGFERVVSKHVFSTKCDKDAHWLECECGYVAEKTAHTMKEEKCAECGYHEHVFEDIFKFDSEAHTFKCSLCDLTEQKGHTLVDCECSECDYSEHSYKIKSDCEYHWEYCEKCDTERERKAHELNNDGMCAECNGQTHKYRLKYGKDTHRYECDTCGAVKDEAKHSLRDGACEICEYKAEIDNADSSGCNGNVIGITVPFAIILLFLPIAFRKKDTE